MKDALSADRLLRRVIIGCTNCPDVLSPRRRGPALRRQATWSPGVLEAPASDRGIVMPCCQKRLRNWVAVGAYAGWRRSVLVVKFLACMSPPRLSAAYDSHHTRWLRRRERIERGHPKENPMLYNTMPNVPALAVPLNDRMILA
jgi:hypothetical protein